MKWIMDPEHRISVVVVALFLGFLLCLSVIGKASNTYELQTSTFKGKEVRVAVYKNRRVISIKGVTGGS